ncbi:unnamed protein product [Linum trigynum]|uniref:Pectinesterase inhibitor domain-containing protein n=1 Tax=Linum trigynum TaxID=586398 RepID=A0AAV2E0N4_9ROSI
MKQLLVSSRYLFLLFAILYFLTLITDAKCVPRNVTHDLSPSDDDANESKSSKEISHAEQSISSTYDEKSNNDDNKQKEEKRDDDDDDEEKNKKKSKHHEKSNEDDAKIEKKSEDYDKNDDGEDVNHEDDDKKEKSHSKEKMGDEDKENSSSSSSIDTTLTQKVCGSTRFPKDCLSSISPFFTGNTDPASILKMEVQAVRKGFTTAIAKVKQMKKDSEGKWNKSALDTCVENFNNGIKDLDSALEAINNHNIDSLQTILSSVLTYVTTCEDAMAEDPDSGELPNITNMEQKLTNLASNSLDIADQLNWT